MSVLEWWVETLSTLQIPVRFALGSLCRWVWELHFCTMDPTMFKGGCFNYWESSNNACLRGFSPVVKTINFNFLLQFLTKRIKRFLFCFCFWVSSLKGFKHEEAGKIYAKTSCSYITHFRR